LRHTVPRALALAIFLASSVSLPSHAGDDDRGKRPASPEPKQARKPAPKASPVPSYTNDDLKKGSAGSTGEGTGEGATSPTPEETPAYETESSETPALVEEQWRSRADAARSAIQTAEDAVRSLEEESKALNLRVLMSTDTNEILDLRRQQQEMATQVEQAKQNLVQAKQAMDDLETEARRASVPPGWLRER